MMRIMTGLVTDPMSSCRDTSEASAAYRAASSTNAKAKRTANQMRAVPSSPSSRSCPVASIPVEAIAAITTTCARARIELPRIFPASSVCAETVASRISTMRVCFSSTTLCAMVVPKVIALIMKTSPKAIAMT